ncbi:MAG TPA: histidine phosphatase family protein [Acidimicrobiales bacterium]|nr:histidine phosphatase family protein [Acidimicrobiales bacterium]
MARLLLLRHGESAWNAVGRWQGHADPPLSAHGEEQARRAGEALGGIGRVVSSDLRRARRTAELLAAASVLGEAYPELRERDVGVWSGLTNSEVDRDYPGDRAAGRTPPGWESDEALVGRVLPVLERLVTGDEAAVLVVAHGGVLRAVEHRLRGEAATAGNLCGYWIEADGGLRVGERVRLLEG